MQPLSEKDSAVLKLIREELDRGVVPSVREIGARLGIKSTSTVHRSLKSLAEKGYILRDDRLGRSIRLPNSKVTHVPILGRVAAGNPILAEEQPAEDYLPMRSFGDDASELFALRVRGDSMIKAGIFDGDVVVARRSSTASSGDIVIALIDDAATVKRFYKENGGYRLQPENDSMSPIYTDRLVILGKVIALHREY